MLRISHARHPRVAAVWTGEQVGLPPWLSCKHRPSLTMLLGPRAAAISPRGASEPTQEASGFMMLKSKVAHLFRWLAGTWQCQTDVPVRWRVLENAGVQPVPASSQHQAPGAVVRRWGTARLLPLRLTGGAALENPAPCRAAHDVRHSSDVPPGKVAC